MTSVLEKYLQQIRDSTSKPGVYAYRGQSRAEWPLHSAATRRLTKSLGDGALNAPWFSKVYIAYNRDTLRLAVGAAATLGTFLMETRLGTYLSPITASQTNPSRLKFGDRTTK